MTDEELIGTVWRLLDEQKRYLATKEPLALATARELADVLWDERKRRTPPKGKSLFEQIDDWDEPNNRGE